MAGQIGNSKYTHEDSKPPYSRLQQLESDIINTDATAVAELGRITNNNPPGTNITFMELETSVTDEPKVDTDELDIHLLKQWGFALYHTTYSSSSKWEATKAKIRELHTDRYLNVADIGQDLDPEAAVLKYVSNYRELSGLTPQQIRLVHFPGYVAPVDGEYARDQYGREHDRIPQHRADNLCAHACLMIDEASMDSILAHTFGSSGWVIAIDVVDEISSQSTGRGRKGVVPWDGTMKVPVENIFCAFFPSIGRNGITMGEIHPPMGEIWNN